jgi:hypothetical protein
MPPFLASPVWRIASSVSALILPFALLALFIANKQASHFKTAYETQVQLNADLVADIELASAKATLEATAAAERKASAYARIQQEKTDALQANLASARSALAAYRMRADARPPQDQRGSGQDGVPRPADASGDPAPSAPADFVLVPASDLDACAVASVTAQGWQDWWTAVSKAP